MCNVNSIQQFFGGLVGDLILIQVLEFAHHFNVNGMSISLHEVDYAALTQGNYVTCGGR